MFSRAIVWMAIAAALCSLSSIAASAAQDAPKSELIKPSDLAEVDLQLDSAIVKPGHPLRGRVVVTIPPDSELLKGDNLQLRASLFKDTGGSKLPIIHVFNGSYYGYQFTSGVVPREIMTMIYAQEKKPSMTTSGMSYAKRPGQFEFSLSQFPGLVSNMDPGDYICLVGLSKEDAWSTSLQAAAWSGFEVKDADNVISLEKLDFLPNPPVKKQMSVLTIGFGLGGLEKRPDGPGDVTVDVFLVRFDSEDPNAKLPWRIGTRKFTDLKGVNGTARGECRVRLTPQEARRYRLAYEVTCAGYEPLKGVVTYRVKDDQSAAAQNEPAGIEYVRTGPPIIEKHEWPNSVPDYTLKVTETGMDSLSTRDNKNSHSQLSWSTPPDLLRDGQVVRLEIRTGASSPAAIGARWYILGERKDWVGEDFLASFEQKGNVACAATLVIPPLAPEADKPVRFFRINAGPWNSSTSADVWWEYKARKATAGGTLIPDELAGSPINRSGGPTESSDVSTGPTSRASQTGAGQESADPANTPPAKPPKPAADIFTGTYHTTYGDWGVVVLKQEGKNVTGTWGGSIYGGEPSGSMTGTAEGQVVKLYWKNRDGTQSGGAMFTQSDDGLYLKGHRNDGKDPEVAHYKWEMKRVTP